MYFVTIIRGKRVGLLAGPFYCHDDALRYVDQARKIASEIDPWSDFDLFGTAKIETDKTGVLNSRLGLE